MSFCLFLLGHAHDGAPPAAADELLAALAAIPGVQSVACHRAAAGARDPKIALESGPDLAIQLHFADLLALEAALAHNGPVGSALRAQPAAGLAWQVQAMAARHYPVAQAWPQADARSGTSYLVAYEGRAVDDAAWLSHYLRHHPPIMARLPGLRRLEIHSRLEHRDESGLPTAQALQRNLVAFDDVPALSAALASPVREALREDYQSFPPFEGTSPHRTMASAWHATPLTGVPA